MAKFRLRMGAMMGVICFVILVIYKNHERFAESDHLKAKINGRAAYERLYTQDPKTGTIPTQRLVEARRYTQRRIKNSRTDLHFEERGPNNVSGRTRAILIDHRDLTGNTIWAGGASGGLWKTIDGGDNWQNVDDFFQSLAIGAIAQDPNNLNIIYFGTGEGFGTVEGRGGGIYRSTDGGNSFQLIPITAAVSDFDYVSDLIVTQNSTLLVATQARYCNRGGILMSTNQGQSWKKFIDDDNCEEVTGTFNFAGDLEEASDGTLYATFGMFGDNDGIYQSNNDGNGWTKVYQAGENESRIELAIAPSNPNIIYALIENFASNGVPFIKKSIDAGQTWTNLPTPRWFFSSNCSSSKANWGDNQDWYNLIAKVDPFDPDIVWIGAIDLFRSEDGGNTWTQLTSWRDSNCKPFVHADHHAIEFITRDRMLFGTDGGIFETRNARAAQPDFTFISHGYNVTQFYSIDYHPEELNEGAIGGTQDNGTQKFTSAGINDTKMVKAGDGGFTHIDQDNPNFQIASTTFNSYYITTDQWQSSRRFSFDVNDGLFINPTDYDDKNNFLYASFAEGSFLRWDASTLSQATKDIVNVNNFPSGPATAVAVSTDEDNRVFFGFSNGEVYRIDNAHSGRNLTGVKIFDEVEGTIACIAMEENKDDHMLVVLSNYGVPSIYESNNAQDPNPLWLSVEGNLPDMPIRWSIFDPTDAGKALVATELGIWSTEKLDANLTQWNPDNQGLANVRCSMIKVRPSDRRVFVATFGRGLFTSDSYFKAVDNDNDGFSSDLDCNDVDPNINPAATEIANNDIDENCDGEFLIIDDDMDGFNSDEDCDDTNPEINPNAEEIVNNGIDEDCDGQDLVSSTSELNGYSVEVFPNPASRFFQVKTDLPSYQLRLYDLSGRVAINLKNVSGKQSINVENFQNGIYLLQILNKGKNFTRRLIVQHL